MTLSETVKPFILYLKVENGVSITTARTYHAHCNAFCRFLRETGRADAIESFTAENIKALQYALTERNLRPRSIRSYFHALRALGEYLFTQGMIEANHALSIKLPKKDAAIRKTANDSEVQALIAACHNLPDPKRCILARAILSMLVYSGVRRNELLAIRVSDYDSSTGSLLIVQGKGGKTRRVFLHKDCRAAVDAYLLQRPKCSHEYLFAFDSLRRFGYKSLQTLFEEIRAVAGLREKVHILPHTLRHWRATDLLRSGADIGQIQTFLGHSTPLTTAIYLHSDEENLKKIADLSALNPPEPQNVKRVNWI